MAAIQLDAKLPLLGLVVAFSAAAALHYDLDKRVVMLAAKADNLERAADKQDDVLKVVADGLAGIEKVLIRFDGRLEKMEYRFGEVEKRLTRLDKGSGP